MNKLRYHLFFASLMFLFGGELSLLLTWTFGWQDSALVWGMFVLGLLIMLVFLLTFVDWRGVGNGIEWTGSATQPYAVAVVGHIKSNPLLWLTIALLGTSICLFLWAIGYENVKAAWYGVFFLELAAVSAITYFNAWDKWRIWQFVFLLFNSMLAIFVGTLDLEMYLFLIVLLVFSGSVMFRKEKEIVQTLWNGFKWLVLQLMKMIIWAGKGISKVLVDLLSGKWGWDMACLGLSAILFGIGMAFLLLPILFGSTVSIDGVAVSVATITIIPSVFLFIASAMLGVKNRLVK